MTRQRHIAWTVLAAALLFSVEFGATAPAVAASISILVNDEPITSYDIKQRTTDAEGVHARKGRRKAGDRPAHRRNAHDAGSDAPALGGERRGGRAGSLRARAQRQAHRRAVRPGDAPGGDRPQGLPGILRANMSWSQIVRARFRATVDITDQDVAAALGKKSEPGATEAATEYMLQPILFLIPKGASKGAENARLQRGGRLPQSLSGLRQRVAQAGGTPGLSSSRTSGAGRWLASAVQAICRGDRGRWRHEAGARAGGLSDRRGLLEERDRRRDGGHRRSARGAHRRARPVARPALSSRPALRRRHRIPVSRLRPGAPLALTLGEPAGIGPDIADRSLAGPRDRRHPALHLRRRSGDPRPARRRARPRRSHSKSSTPSMRPQHLRRRPAMPCRRCRRSPARRARSTPPTRRR